MAFKRIILVGEGRRKEHNSTAAVKPGRLVEYHDSSGLKIRLHSNDGGALGHNTRFDIAIENELAGKDIDTDWASGDNVQHNVLNSGDEALAWLKDEENVAVGAPLTPDGAGGLRAAVLGTDEVVAYAMEALDLTGASGDARIIVEVA